MWELLAVQVALYPTRSRYPDLGEHLEDNGGGQRRKRVLVRVIGE
jgi:hypothetical protein